MVGAPLPLVITEKLVPRLGLELMLSGFFCSRSFSRGRPSHHHHSVERAYEGFHSIGSLFYVLPDSHYLRKLLESITISKRYGPSSRDALCFCVNAPSITLPV